MAQYSRLTRRNAAVAIFLPLVLCATSFSTVPLWLGERPDGVVMVLAALAPAVAVRVSTNVCTSSMIALGRNGILCATAVASAAIAIALAIPLTQAFGFKGMVAAFACWIVVGNLLGVWFLQSRMGISMTEYLRAIRGPFAVGIVATLAALPIGIITMPQDRASALIPFLLSTAIFCTIYAILGWRLHYLPRFRGGWQEESVSHRQPDVSVRSRAASSDIASPRGRTNKRAAPKQCAPLEPEVDGDCRLNGGTGWSEIRKESDHD
jgi:hypothetical protein